MPLAIAAHRVLADPEAQVAPELLGAEVGLALDVGQVRLGQVRGPAEQLGQVRRQRLDGVLARVPGGHLGPGLVGLEVRVPAGRQLTGDPAAELGGEFRARRGIDIESRAPVGLQPLAVRDRVAEDGQRLIGDVERLVRVPAVGLLHEANLVRAQRCAVRLLAVLLVRAAVADVGPDRDQARPVVGPGGLDGRLDRADVVAVLDPARVPAVGIEALDDVLGEGHRRRPVELDVVVVVEDDELAESEVPGEARRLGGDAFLEIAVGGDDVGPVVDDGAFGPVELGHQPPLGDRHADRVGEALAERTGRRLDTGRQPVFGMTRRLAAPLAEVLDLVERQVVAGQVQQRVQEHARVPGTEDEPVAVRPVGLGRGVAQEPGPQHVRHRRRAHRGARVPGVRLLDGVDGERPDRVDREAVEVGLHGGHGRTPVVATSGSAGRW